METIRSLLAFLLLRRHVVTVMVFLGFINIYALRVNLSVAIVDMTTNHHEQKLPNGTVYHFRYFDWDSKQRGAILSAFFYGYICTQLLGGWLGTKYGGINVFGISIFVTAVLTLFTPYCAKFGMQAIFILRVLEGIFEGFSYPSVQAILATWAPPVERTRLSAIVYAGSHMGTVITFPACGLIITNLGWPYTFYIPGFVGLVWYAMWLLLITNNPIDDKYITAEELDYLHKSLGQKEKHITYPWKAIFISVPVWATIVAHCCESWSFYILLTQLPTFLTDRFDYDLTEVGFLSALPYICRSVLMISAGITADQIVQKNILTTTQVRKLFNCSAFLIEALMITITGFINLPVISVICLMCFVGAGGIGSTGFSVIPLDIAPQYASVIFGISNTFATLAGILSPTAAGYIVVNGSESEWRILFLSAAGMLIFGSIVFGIFSSGERQSWAMDSDEKIEEGETIDLGVIMD